MSDNAVRSFRDLKIWQRSMTLVTHVYAATAAFPKEEIYGLTSQIRRSAVSVPSNIAEGSSKRSTREFIRFLNISYGSLAELETQLQIAVNLSFLNSESIKPALEEINEIGRMINGLIHKLDTKIPEL